MSVVSLLPVFLAFLFGQKYLVKGIATTGHQVTRRSHPKAAIAIPTVCAVARGAPPSVRRHHAAGRGASRLGRLRRRSEPDDGKVHLRFTWWGSDSRHKATQQVIDAFQAQHPNIDVKGEFGELDRLLGQARHHVAANDAPDIIQMDEKYLRDYADRGALLDLKTQADVLDTSKFDAEGAEDR